MKTMCALFAGMMIETSVNAATPVTLPSEDRILPSSLELERKVEPWCPGDCAVGVPFVTSYRKGKERLVFVGAHHAFQANAPTMLAVAAGFAMIHPKVVIVEGFPTAMGENPPPLVEEARRYGTPGTDEYGRGEPMYAASNIAFAFIGVGLAVSSFFVTRVRGAFSREPGIPATRTHRVILFLTGVALFLKAILGMVA